jgi:hypothetical protein
MAAKKTATPPAETPSLTDRYVEAVERIVQTAMSQFAKEVVDFKLAPSTARVYTEGFSDALMPVVGTQLMNEFVTAMQLVSMDWEREAPEG